MAASTILLAISKQSEKPRKLVGAMLQTFYIIRFRTDPCLVLESAGIFSVWEGFSLTHRSTCSRCLWEPDADPVPGFSLPTFSTQQAEHRGCFAERTLAPSFRVLLCLFAVLSRFFEFRSDMYFRHPFDAQGFEAQKGEMHHGVWFDVSSFLSEICWWRDSPLTDECCLDLEAAQFTP